jgi:hypothetical protein
VTARDEGNAIADEYRNHRNHELVDRAIVSESLFDPETQRETRRGMSTQGLGAYKKHPQFGPAVARNSHAPGGGGRTALGYIILPVP